MEYNSIIFQFDLQGFNHLSKRVKVEDSEESYDTIHTHEDFYLAFIPDKMEYARVRAVGNDAKKMLLDSATNKQTLTEYYLKRNRDRDYVTYGRGEPVQKIPTGFFTSFKQSIMLWTSFNRLGLSSHGVPTDRNRSISMTYSSRYKDILVRLAVGSLIIKIEKRELNNARQKFVKKYGNSINSIELTATEANLSLNNIVLTGKKRVYITYELYQEIQKQVAIGAEYFSCIACRAKNANYEDDEGLNLLIYVEPFCASSPLSLAVSGREVLEDSKTFKTIVVEKRMPEMMDRIPAPSEERSESTPIVVNKAVITKVHDSYILKFPTPNFLSNLLSTRHLSPVSNLMESENLLGKLEEFTEWIKTMPSFGHHEQEALTIEQMRSIEKLKNIFFSAT